MDFAKDLQRELASGLSDLVGSVGWTQLREVLLTNYSGNVIAAGAKYPRSVYWHSLASQTREQGTAVLPGNSEILYQENPAYIGNPPQIAIGYPPKSDILTVYGYNSQAGLLTQGNTSQPEQYAYSLKNPHISNIIDLRVDPPDDGSLGVKINPGAYFKSSAPGVAQYISVAESYDLSTLAGSLSGLQHQLACVYLDREAGTFGATATTAVSAGRGFVPSYAELDTPATAQSIVLSANQKPLGYVYLYALQAAVTVNDIFSDLDPRLASEELGDYLPLTGGEITGALTVDGNLQANLWRLPTATTLTLAASAVTITQGYHLIEASSGTTDNLATISGGVAQQLLIIQADSDDTITVKHGTGNIFLNSGADQPLSGKQTLALFYHGSNWTDIDFGGGGGGGTAAAYWGQPAQAAMTTNVTVSNPGTSTFDGYSASSGDIILLTGQTTTSENGPQTFNGSSSAMTRPTSYASASATLALPNMLFWVVNGTVNAHSVWRLTTTGTITIDTTATAWALWKLDSVDVGTITPAHGWFSELKLKIGGFFGKFTHSNTADRTYNFPDYDGTIATVAGSETLTNKTLTQPTIGDFTNADHDHHNAAKGGQLTDAALSAAIGVAKGGTGADLSSTGGANNFVKQSSVGTALSVGAIASADLTAALTTPPAIGGATPAAGAFTTLNASGILTAQSGQVVAKRVVTAAGAVTMATTDYWVGINKTVGAATAVGLPSSPTAGQIYFIFDLKGDAGTNGITITPASGTVNNAANVVIGLNNGAAILLYDSGQWEAIILSNGAGVSLTTTTQAIDIAVRLYDTQLGADGEFTNISIDTSYDWLEIIVTGRGTDVATSVLANLYFNNDTTAANYVRLNMTGSGSAAASANANNANALRFPAASATANYWGFATVIISNANDSNKFKTAEARWDENTSTSAGEVGASHFQWLSTAAINRIDLIDVNDATGKFANGSHLTIIGHKSATVVTGVSAAGTPAPGTAQPHTVTFTQEGVLTASSKPLRVYNNFGQARTITGVYLACNTTPSGQAIIVDVLKNGSTIFTNTAHRPQIAAAALTGSSTTIDVPTWSANDYFQFQIAQVGSGTAGSDLTVEIMVQ